MCGPVESQVLLLRGEAGVGKSVLLDYLLQQASGCHIARAAGVESEMELAYSGLHQLCAPMLDRMERLPGPQREALGTAFGMSAGAVPDRFFVGLAVLGLLSEIAADRPLVCVVDDAQWQDRESVQTLAFVARRLLAESVGLVFAVREPSDGLEMAGLPELVVAGLNDGDARTLLDSAIRGRLDERLRDRIVAEARGNPLALLELPRGLTPAEIAGGFGLPEVIPLANRIEQSFLRQLESLPTETRRMLLIAAAEPVGDVPLLLRAAGRSDSKPTRRRPPSCRLDRARRPRAVPSSAHALGGLPRGVPARAAACPSGTGGSNGSRGGSGSPRMASRSRRGRPRRSDSE